jgi:roundabout axon guidance receptor 2
MARVNTVDNSRIRAYVRVELVLQNCFNICLLFQIGDLKPDTSYVFLVRAENSHGLSVPSPVSEVARTLGSDRRSVPQYELDEARVRLGTKVVQLRDVQPVSSTSVRLLWDVSCLQNL